MAAKAAQLQRGECHAENLFFITQLCQRMTKRERGRERVSVEVGESDAHCMHIFALAKKVFGHCFPVNGPRPIVSYNPAWFFSLRQLLGSAPAVACAWITLSCKCNFFGITLAKVAGNLLTSNANGADWSIM